MFAGRSHCMARRVYRSVIPVFFLALPVISAAAAPFPLPADAVVTVQEFMFPEPAANAGARDLPARLRIHITDALRAAGFTLAVSPSVPARESAAGKTQDSPMTGTPIAENGDETTPQTAHDAGTAEAESPGSETPAKEIPAAESPAAVYAITGRVTFLRENIGNPVRIGGGIHVRAESALHCAYQVADAWGHVLISTTASGSAARLTTDARNIDAVIADLNEKVLLSVAEKIASTLSGTDAPSSASPSSRERRYYQDSPGKRLRQN